MTIYWRGRGILAIIIPFVLIFMLSFIGKDSQLVVSIMLILAGLIVFGLGKKWNANEQNLEIGQNELSSNLKIPKHSFFWVAMEYFGVIELFYGLAILINELFAFNFLDLIHGVSVAGIVITMFVNRRRENKYLKQLKGKTSENIVKDESRFKNRLIKKSNFATPKDSKKSKTNEKKLKEKNEKQKVFEELRNIRNKEETFKPSNHEDYIPK